LANEVEREQGVAKVVEHPHEDDEVEALAQSADIVDVGLRELDVVMAERLGGEPRLGEVALVAVNAEHARGAAALHLDRIETRVAADVEHALAGDVGQFAGEPAELGARIIAKEM